MRARKIMLVSVLALLVSASFAMAGTKRQKKAMPAPPPVNQITADVALTGIPLDITPGQLPDQFTTQLRNDVSKARGIAVLKQKGNDIEYTFAFWDLTSPLTQAHFHYGPKGHVGARAESICGVVGESPECPKGTRTSIMGVWRNADVNAVKAGDVVIAFHTEKYPPPGGELAVYIPAPKKAARAGAATHTHAGTK